MPSKKNGPRKNESEKTQVEAIWKPTPRRAAGRQTAPRSKTPGKAKRGPAREFDFSADVSGKTREFFEKNKTLCVGGVCRKEVVERVNMLYGMVTALTDHMKSDSSYDPNLEEALKEIVTQCLSKGIELGSKYDGTPEDLLETIALIPIHPSQVISKMPSEKRKTGKYVLQSLLIGKFAYETGFAISATLSKEMLGKYMKTLKEETRLYIT